MFNIIVFMLIPFHAIFQQNGSHIEFLFTTRGLDTYLDSSAIIDLILTELLFLRLSQSKFGGTSGHICQPSWIFMICIMGYD